MAITANQIQDIFQKQVGRPPTPFEISKYSTASIQDLTGLKNTFQKYQPDSSVSDYLSLQGQDPSLQNQKTYASLYGMNDYNGGFDQSQTLLSKIKNKEFATPATVGGTIAGATTTDNTPKVGGTVSSPMNDPTLVDNTQKNNIANYGSAPNESPEQSQARQVVDTHSQELSSLKKQRDDINNTINATLQNRRDEITRSGGVVDESQLRSDVLATNAPLLAERNALSAQISEATANYNTANKNYNDIVSSSFKNEQLKQGQEKIDLASSQGQQKIDQTNTKMDIQQTQFTQKLEQTGWKSTKVNVYDPAGNVIGNKIVWTENPGSAPTDNKAQFTTTSSGSGGISKNGTTNMGQTSELPKLTLADGATPAQVLQTLISGKPVYIKGSTTPLSQQDLYFLAIQDMLGATSTVGGRTPSGAILSVKHKETEIADAYGLTPFDIAIAKTQYKNLGSANLQLLQTSSFIHTYGSTAVDNLNLALEQSKLVPRGGAKMKNNFTNWLKGEFTPAGDLAKFETYIYTAGREYAKVTSGGAKSSAELSITAQNKVEELINSAQAPEVFVAVVQAMEADMNNVIGNFDKQTNNFPNEIKALYGMASKTPDLMRSSVPDAKTFVEKSLVRQGYNYDTLMKEMKTTTPAGTQPALDNETGQPVYATEDDIKSGKATPL